MSEAPSTGYLEERARREWEQRLRSSGAPAAEWALLGAYLARADCDGDYSSPVHAERLAFASRTLDRLLERDSLNFALGDLHRTTLVRRLRPQLLSTAVVR